MTNTEYRDYRRLKSQPDRQGFIRGFWDRRDPLPETHENELEREFWDRVRTADEHFGQEIKPGWKTERGKVYIMLGPPENVEDDAILADRWGASRWIYDLGSMPLQFRLVLRDCLQVPSERRFVKIKVREETEGTRAVGSSVPVSQSVLRPTNLLPLAESLVRRVSGPESLRNLGHLMRVPEVLERLDSRVNVSTVFSMVPVQARIDFHPAARTAPERTSVAVTLGVKWPDLEAAGVTLFDPSGAIPTGYLTSADNEQRSYPLKDSFAPDPAPEAWTDPRGATYVFQAVAEVPPGSYLLDVAYLDATERVMGSVRDWITVPAFATRTLSVSSLILSSRIDHLQEAVGVAAGAPFTLGSYRVIPRTTQVYKEGSDLTLFYQVYGAQAGADGLPHLDLTYQFYIEDAGIWLPVGSSIVVGEANELAQAWRVPLREWPSGRYRIEASVLDTVSGLTVVRGTLFEIAAQAD